MLKICYWYSYYWLTKYPKTYAQFGYLRTIPMELLLILSGSVFGTLCKFYKTEFFFTYVINIKCTDHFITSVHRHISEHTPKSCFRVEFVILCKRIHTIWWQEHIHQPALHKMYRSAHTKLKKKKIKHVNRLSSSLSYKCNSILGKCDTHTVRTILAPKLFMYVWDAQWGSSLWSV